MDDMDRMLSLPSDDPAACDAMIGQPDGPVYLSRTAPAKVKQIRQIASLHREYLQVLCNKASGVDDLGDLESDPKAYMNSNGDNTMPHTKTTTASMDIDIGRRIRDIRKAKGLSQTDLAEFLGMTFQQVQKYEGGKNRISTSALILICQKLGVSPMDIIGPLIGEPSATAGLIDQVASLKQQLSDLKSSIRSAVK